MDCDIKLLITETYVSQTQKKNTLRETMQSVKSEESENGLDFIFHQGLFPPEEAAVVCQCAVVTITAVMANSNLKAAPALLLKYQNSQ